MQANSRRMGLYGTRQMHQHRQCRPYHKCSQCIHRCLDSLLAMATAVEVESSKGKEGPTYRHVFARWFVCFGSMPWSNNNLLTVGVTACVLLVCTEWRRLTNFHLKMLHVCAPDTFNRYLELSLTSAGRVRCRRSHLVNRRSLRRNFQCMPPSFSPHL